jgi:S-adenosylmethionine:tRNA ribosyltransferase-isomerase
MNDPRTISIEDYNYELPDEYIAKFPRKNREDARLLIYSEGDISDDIFSSIDTVLKKDDLLLLNETKVIPARVHFKKSTGGEIEIFLLQPSVMDHAEAMDQRSEVTWEAMVGGAKKWKDGPLTRTIILGNTSFDLFAEKISNEGGTFQIKFSWNNNAVSFSELLAEIGELPLPPYFERKADAEDYDRYQTVFARFEGSVAAPTAGLHFTPGVLEKLSKQGVLSERITLHVGSGTFKPVSAGSMEGHDMHGEVFTVDTTLIQKLMVSQGRIIPVGTTSMRTIESLYWIGVKLIIGAPMSEKGISLSQWDPYDLPQHYSKEESLQAILNYCDKIGLAQVSGVTSVLIAPGYEFRIAQGLITNFHLPKSTLILLVSALVGDRWRDIYAHAKNSGFKFLSYGDSSILLP